MIIDSINNLLRYHIPFAQSIATFIATHDCANLANEEYAIEGKQLFVRVQTYIPRQAGENKFETHLVHTDVQYIARGHEIIQIAAPATLSPEMEYNEEQDYRLYQPTAQTRTTDIQLSAGHFALFAPMEAHRPCCKAVSEDVEVKKLVFKLRHAY